MPNANYRKLTWQDLFTLLTVAVITIGSLGGCHEHPKNIESAHRRGLAENDIRIKFGMRRVSPDWICFRSINHLDEWVTDLRKDNAAVKAVKHDAQSLLLWEEDRYRSGKIVDIDDARVEEEIVLTCDYVSSQLAISYIGIDREIKAAIEAATTNQKRLEVIRRAKLKWGLRE